jgi:hypothetical protein
VDGRRKQNWKVDDARACGQSTKRFEIMAAEEGGGGAADEAAAGVWEGMLIGALLMKRLCSDVQ